MTTALVLLLAGCATTPPPPPAPPADLAASLAAGCAADAPGTPLDLALAVQGVERAGLAISAHDLRFSDYHVEGDLDDSHRAPLLDVLMTSPWRAGCVHDALAGIADHAARSARPASALVALGAELLGRPLPERATASHGKSFYAALAALCAPVHCPAAQGRLPVEIAAALAPVLEAALVAVVARAARYQAAGLPESGHWYTDSGALYRAMFAPAPYPALDDPAVDSLLRGPANDVFHAAAADLIRAVEDARLARFAGLRGFEWDQHTPLGRIRVRDAHDHRHDDAEGPFLLLVDLGGDEHYTGAAGASRPGAPVSVLVDVAGDDRYGYVGVPGTADALLAADDGSGRRAAGSPPQTLSDVSRQGVGRDGVGLLMDLRGDDVYLSLAASQGHAQSGVGVLLDAAGHDRYEAELLAQGAAQFGIAVAADLGAGNDLRRAYGAAQGFGYVAGAGLLYDGGGDDRYECVPGDIAHGGRLLYPSSQLPGRGNLSFCQGAGYGRRDDGGRVYRAGGVGLLRDLGGDDTYLASVFAQGVGYWQGVGLLADGAGDDRYDGDWYVQGASAHYAAGLLFDSGGDDAYGESIAATQMQLGAGHDYGLGVLIDEAGDDRYRVARLGAGASNCSGRGLFVDNGGDDRYASDSALVLGLGNVGEECMATRRETRSIGIMLDGGGADVYAVPAERRPRPADDSRFGLAAANLAGEIGIAIDGDADTGIHATPPAR